ncbi:MAG: hypothetical protein ABIS01_08995 [Ferruginibacter sp.]
MKKAVTIGIGLCLCTIGLFAQKVETIQVKGDEAAAFISKATYKFPEFVKARVYFKNGDVSAGRFNYDYFNQLMKFIYESGDTLVIANEKDVKFVNLGSDTFFYDNQYYEWVASAGNARLTSRTTYRLSRKDNVGAYGTSSPAIKVEARDEILDNTKYKLKVNEILIFLKETNYYISSMKGQFVLANKKNIGKLFPGKNIEDYINQNKLNLNREEDLVNVIAYAGNR